MGKAKQNEEFEETGDPSVPTDLLELHLELEDSDMTPEQFKEVYGNEAGS